LLIRTKVRDGTSFWFKYCRDALISSAGNKVSADAGRQRSDDSKVAGKWDKLRIENTSTETSQGLEAALAKLSDVNKL
jgi:hypothetical protein